MSAEDSLLPDATSNYQSKDAMRAFCLKEADIDKVPYTSQRNFSGPYPIRQYKGADLLAYAQQKFGVEGFVAKLKRQANRWRYPSEPTGPGPAFRYFVVRGARESLKTSQNSGLWSIHKKLQNRLMQAFQESDAVVLLFSPINSRAFTSYGFMLTPPGHDLGALDPKGWATLGVMSTFKVEWKPPVYVRMDRMPRLYDDQDECLAEDGQEVPTDLGEIIVDALEEEQVEERRGSAHASPAPAGSRSPRARSPARRRSRSPPRRL